MSSERIEVLKNLAKQNPSDQRIRYMLAMELGNTGDLEGAVSEYRAIIADDADYIAAYLHGGHALVKLGLLEQAREIYRRGIEACDRTGDKHTRNELEASLEALS